MSGERVPELWTHKGRRVHDGKLYRAWTCGHPDHHDHMFTASRGDTFAVGGVYSVQVSPDHKTAWFGDSTKYVGDSDDQEKVRQWVALDREALVVMDVAKAEASAKKAEAGALAAMTLSEARTFVGSGPWSTRAARLAVVLRYLGA